MTKPLAEVLPKTVAAIESGIEDSWHLGAQICVWRDGRAVVNDGIGTVDGSSPMTARSVNLWFSSGKPVGAVAVKLLEREGLLDIDVPVADYWPEFGANGKEAITMRHILTHTAGIRTADAAESAESLDEALSVIANARVEPGWIIGTDGGYHTFGGWQVIGELVQRLSGLPYDQFTGQRIFKPLGMTSSTFNLLAAESAEVRSGVVPMHNSKGGEFKQDRRYTPEFVSSFPRPGGGLYSTASDMVRLYRMLLGLGEVEGVRLLEPAEVVDVTSPQRTGIVDKTFGHVMDWGLGVMFDNKIHGPNAPYGYGNHASAQTFGHGGRESSVAFADPQNDLAVAVVFNGMPGEPTHHRRVRAVTTAIYEDLGLA